MDEEGVFLGTMWPPATGSRRARSAAESSPALAPRPRKPAGGLHALCRSRAVPLGEFATTRRSTIPLILEGVDELGISSLLSSRRPTSTIAPAPWKKSPAARSFRELAEHLPKLALLAQQDQKAVSDPLEGYRFTPRHAAPSHEP